MTRRNGENDGPGGVDDSQAGVAPTTNLGSLLEAAKLPKPSPERTKPAKEASRARSPRLSPEDRARELEARKRVATLVSGGIGFKLKRDGHHVQAGRGAAAAKHFARLSGKTFAPEVTLDVRTQVGVEVRDSIASYLRLVHRRGVRQLLITVDDGSGLEQERDQRREDAIAALTQGAAAPLVRAFTTAHASLGGTNGLAVLLI